MISIFTQSRTKDMSALKNFLDENKAGTFLENATLALSTRTTSNDTLTITLGDSEIKLATLGSTSTGYNDVEYTGENMTAALKSDSGWNSAYPYISKLMLCKNGIVFEYYRRNGGDTDSSDRPAYPIAITADGSGNLAMLYWTANSLSAANKYVPYEYYAITYDSLTVSAVNVVPQNNAQRTCLSPIVPNTSDNTITLPYAYVTTQQQLSGAGLTKVVMDGTYYITNGQWYIKDE